MKGEETIKEVINLTARPWLRERKTRAVPSRGNMGEGPAVGVRDTAQ